MTPVIALEHEAPRRTLHRFDLEMPFRPTVEQVAHYAAAGDFVMLFNLITLAVVPTYLE